MGYEDPRMTRRMYKAQRRANKYAYRAQRRVDRYRYKLDRRIYGRSGYRVPGFLVLLFCLLLFSWIHTWVWFVLGAIAVVCIVTALRWLGQGQTNFFSDNQPQQPNYPPSSPGQQQDYNVDYGQGYQASPPPQTYSEGDKQYYYPPQTSSQYDQPQSHYPGQEQPPLMQ
ncbi:hypothetical protein [Tengunoibacter tsumagoiensis]|uniref:Uncharacterized protein n=1 Tax=Tengunoibacter tsumagoiensis TaxID=2014871 RepID=A0A402A419_9CHLR|nr:hypothetical protein [Tengunoibacter tsumagoiensis]GCE13842.1 hypothetical protein KTT_37010 [Tengunoibacter tsumagoiensis]